MSSSRGGRLTRRRCVALMAIVAPVSTVLVLTHCVTMPPARHSHVIVIAAPRHAGTPLQSSSVADRSVPATGLRGHRCGTPDAYGTQRPITAPDPRRGRRIRTELDERTDATWSWPNGGPASYCHGAGAPSATNAIRNGRVIRRGCASTLRSGHRAAHVCLVSGGARDALQRRKAGTGGWNSESTRQCLLDHREHSRRAPHCRLHGDRLWQSLPLHPCQGATESPDAGGAGNQLDTQTTKRVDAHSCTRGRASAGVYDGTSEVGAQSPDGSAQ